MAYTWRCSEESLQMECCVGLKFLQPRALHSTTTYSKIGNSSRQLPLAEILHSQRDTPSRSQNLIHELDVLYVFLERLKGIDTL